MARTSLEELLQECVEPLRPYLDQLVVAGGWVPYLYTKVYGGVIAIKPPRTSTTHSTFLIRFRIGAMQF